MNLEKIQAIADKYGYNLATNLGQNEVLKLILSTMSDDDIKDFYADTFMMFDDEIDSLYEEIREKTDDELRDEAASDRHEYERGN